MKSLVVPALALVTTIAAWLAQDPSQPPQPPQTFKSSVDLVPVDVNVVDRNGRPISDLTAQDFSLKVDGKARRVVSAQFIGVTRGVERTPKEPALYSSNPPSSGARLIMLVVDQGNIGSSRGKYAMMPRRDSSIG